MATTKFAGHRREPCTILTLMLASVEILLELGVVSMITLAGVDPVIDLSWVGYGQLLGQIGVPDHIKGLRKIYRNKAVSGMGKRKVNRGKGNVLLWIYIEFKREYLTKVKGFVV